MTSSPSVSHILFYGRWNHSYGCSHTLIPCSDYQWLYSTVERLFEVLWNRLCINTIFKNNQHIIIQIILWTRPWLILRNNEHVCYIWCNWQNVPLNWTNSLNNFPIAGVWVVKSSILTYVVTAHTYWNILIGRKQYNCTVSVFPSFKYPSFSYWHFPLNIRTFLNCFGTATYSSLQATYLTAASYRGWKPVVSRPNSPNTSNIIPENTLIAKRNLIYCLLPSQIRWLELSVLCCSWLILSVRLEKYLHRPAQPFRNSDDCSSTLFCV